MFRWFGKKKSPPVEETDAYKKGQQLANQIVDAFDEFMEGRFTPVRDNYLNVLRVQLQKVLQSSEAPPLTVGRIEFNIFADNVKEMEPQMLQEINAAMARWMDVADMVGMRSRMDELFKKRTSDYTSDLTMQGFKLLVDYAVPLKDADVAWRKANPEIAAKFPEEEPLPESY